MWVHTRRFCQLPIAFKRHSAVGRFWTDLNCADLAVCGCRAPLGITRHESYSLYAVADVMWHTGCSRRAMASDAIGCPSIAHFAVIRGMLLRARSCWYDTNSLKYEYLQVDTCQVVRPAVQMYDQFCWGA